MGARDRAPISTRVSLSADGIDVLKDVSINLSGNPGGGTQGASSDRLRLLSSIDDCRLDDVHVIIQGFACRSKVTRDGGRQIMALVVPGDMCDIHVAILDSMDHDIVTLTPCKLGHISPTSIRL